MASLDALRPFGVLVSYGNASGPVEPFSPSILAPKGSLYVTRPTLATHIATRELLDEAAQNLFGAISDGLLHIQINQVYALADTAQAHRDLEVRRTTGSSVLLVDDEDAILQMTRQMLEHLGYHVTATNSSPDAEPTTNNLDIRM